jgi:hypothetical protein
LTVDNTYQYHQCFKTCRFHPDMAFVKHYYSRWSSGTGTGTLSFIMPDHDTVLCLKTSTKIKKTFPNTYRYYFHIGKMECFQFTAGTFATGIYCTYRYSSFKLINYRSILKKNKFQNSASNIAFICIVVWNLHKSSLANFF